MTDEIEPEAEHISHLSHELATLQERYNHDVGMLERELVLLHTDLTLNERRTASADEPAGVVSQVTFGIFDGMTTVAGVIFGLLAKGNGTIIAAAAGVAAASTCGMAAGEYLSDSDNGIREAVAIGAATGFGTIAPVIPFLFLGKTASLVIATVVAVLFGVLIGHARRKKWRGYVETFVILLVASVATVGVTALIPASAGS